MAKKIMDSKTKKLLKVQEQLREMGYTATIDDRMGLQRMHVWNIRRSTSVPTIQSIVGEKFVCRKHTEIGVWVQLD